MVERGRPRRHVRTGQQNRHVELSVFMGRGPGRGLGFGPGLRLNFLCFFPLSEFFSTSLQAVLNDGLIIILLLYMGEREGVQAGCGMVRMIGLPL